MKKIILLALIPFLGINLQSIAQGNLLVNPSRVVFEGNKQKEELNIVNTGNDTAVYSVSFLQYNMTEEGGFEIIEKPGQDQKFADPYLRVFPRQIKLGPREAQVIRLQLRKKSDMAAGEYRSHLYFRSEKDRAPLGMESKQKDSSLMSVQITPIFGISIPVIIRIGEGKAASTISNLKFEKQDTTQNLKFSINRTGNVSTYGDLIAEYIPNQGKPVEIGIMRGVAVYTTINKRNVTLKINQVKGINLNNGKIKLRYTSPKDTPYVLYAEQEIAL